MQPRDAQESPRRARKAPKSVPEPRCWAPRTAKSHPRASQELTNASPKRCNSTPERRKQRFWAQRCMRKALEAIFRRFLRRARSLRSVFRPNETVVLLHPEHDGSGSSPARKNFENHCLGWPKSTKIEPKVLQNRSRSAPRRTKTGQAEQKTQQETQNARKKRPRGKKDANIVFFEPNMATNQVSRWDGWAPLRY